MKKTFRTVGAVGLLAVLSPLFFACGDDDEPDLRPVVPELDGKRLSSVGGAGIDYDSNGNIIKITDSDGDYMTIDPATGKAVFSDMEEGEEAECTIEYNHIGFISEINTSFRNEEDGIKTNGFQNIDYSYNNENNLVKIETSLREEMQDISSQQTLAYTVKTNVNLIWNSGNLKTIKEHKVESIGGMKDEENFTYTISYGTQDNKFRQFPLALAETTYGDLDYWCVFTAAGRMGAGPAQLPTHIEDSDDPFENIDVAYTLNSDGTIADETFDGGKYVWGYKNKTRSSFSKSLRLGFPLRRNIKALFLKK